MKAKKVLAMLMASAMIMGTTVTVFADATDVSKEDPEFLSNVTIEGLSADVPTDIDMYRFATLQYDSDTNEYSWKIEEWADDYVTLNAAKTAYEIPSESEAALKNAAQTIDGTPEYSIEDVTGTSHTFYDVWVGGYIVIPSDENADYMPLFATNTYDRVNSPDENGKPEAIDVTAYAKSENHTITKKENDDFAQIGQEVNYTINATFPMSENAEGETLDRFVITDTPTGLKINQNTVKVTLAGVDITSQITTNVAADTGILTVDFANILAGKHDGKAIVITYSATVTDVEYNNNASANSNTTEYVPGTVDGENGSIEITKVDAEDNKKVLEGAEFEVYDLGVDGVWNGTGTPMRLVYDADLLAYRPALANDPAENIKTQIPTIGSVLMIVGLDEGNYHFKETKAPNGYSINDEGLTVTVANEDGNIDVARNFEDTKLAELPETGGIGTTIFTIGGCVIMVTAAGLYFATRKKEQN